MRVSAYDKPSGNLMGFLDVVVPVASETDCQNCHTTGQMAAADPTIPWSDDSDPEAQSKKNILILLNVDDDRWIDEEHGEFYERNENGCKACHGNDLLGTFLAKMPVARTFRIEDDEIVNFAKNEFVGCNRCHGLPDV